MSLETIDRTWRPSKKTSDTLKSPKYGYTQEQVNDLGRKFIQRYLNKQVQGASHKFFEFVRTSGVGHNMPKPSREADKQQAEQRANNFANKSENSAERLKAIKDHIRYQIGEDQLRLNLAMIADNWGWTDEQQRKWLERELEKDSHRLKRSSETSQ